MSTLTLDLFYGKIFTSQPLTKIFVGIGLGVHTERNCAIVRLLTQLGYVSAIGTGIPRPIIRLSRALSGREPEFEVTGEELRLL